MPKTSKRKRKERAALGGSRKGLSAPSQAPVGLHASEEDSDGLDVEDMLGEDGGLEQEHALFLTKMKP